MTPKHQPCEAIIQIERTLNGNGEKGTLAKVDDHETFIQQWTGAFKLLKWILGTSALGLLLSIAGLIITLTRISQ
jgi:hypothetical protein